MSVQTVNGFLYDFQGAAPGLDPRIIWKPTSSTIIGSAFLFSRNIETVPASNGSWSDQFESTDLATPEVWYEPQLWWFEGNPAGGRWTYQDFPNLKLFVPSTGGPFNFTDIVNAPTNPGTLIFEMGPPPDDLSPGTWYYDMSAEPGSNNFYEGS